MLDVLRDARRCSAAREPSGWIRAITRCAACNGGCNVRQVSKAWMARSRRPSRRSAAAEQNAPAASRVLVAHRRECQLYQTLALL